MGFEPGILIGTRSADHIRASGHVPREQAGHMTCTRPQAAHQIPLATRAPSTHDPGVRARSIVGSGARLWRGPGGAPHACCVPALSPSADRGSAVRGSDAQAAHYRRQADRGRGRHHPDPGLRAGRRRDSPLLLSRAPVDRRQLPHVPGRGAGHAQACRLMRHGRQRSSAQPRQQRRSRS